MSWSHYCNIRIILYIRSVSAHNSYVGQQAIIYDMIAYRILMYSSVGWIPETSVASATGGYSHCDLGLLVNSTSAQEGWDIMGYESDILPSYYELRNCSYSIKLNYTSSPSTPQVHLPRLVPTIVPSRSSMASVPPLCTAHIWGDRPSFPIWLPASS